MPVAIEWKREGTMKWKYQIRVSDLNKDQLRISLVAVRLCIGKMFKQLPSSSFRHEALNPNSKLKP